MKTRSRVPSTMYAINPDFDTEDLLVHACESLASAIVMACDLAQTFQWPSRNALLGIVQIIMLGELAVNRELDRLDRWRNPDTGRRGRGCPCHCS
ncbi:DUF6124 family protein [Pseudomonas sp. N40(2020)]|uniref:DUF6124 family protein n=1 Tax=Pseudomonas sp. N40(2020) TaxID=2767798 RepID=UPI003976581E